MSTKLIACLLAACVVAVGGVHLYTGKSLCPFSGSCPTGECSLAKTGACCADSEDATASCCEMKAVSTKVCCEAESEVAATCPSTACPMTAAFGGLVAAKK